MAQTAPAAPQTSPAAPTPPVAPDAEAEVDAASSTSASAPGAPQPAGQPKSTGTPTQPASTIQPPASSAKAARLPSAAPVADPARADVPSSVDDKPKEPVVEIKGYAQLEYQSHADSADQLTQDGTLLNQNRFLVRRMRVVLMRRYDYSGYLVELDGNTTNGPTFGLQRAEGNLFYVNKPGELPLVELTAGLLLLPFGSEVHESPRTRWFMERTTTSRALFPTEVDVGARLHGAWRFLRYGVALTNGEPKGTKANSFQLQDPNRAKDVTLRIGADVPASDAFRISGGVSYLAGKGFTPGQTATKSRLDWTDTNEDGIITIDELKSRPATAAVPSESFRRWALGADLQVRLRTAIGWTALFGEAIAAVNLDRGMFVALPTASTPDRREFGWNVGFAQEITPYAVVGFRYDSYNPDSDLLDSRGGVFLPNNQTIATYSPLVGLTLPDRARLVFQYDFIRDNLARDKSGVVTDLSNNQWTLRLQVSL